MWEDDRDDWRAPPLADLLIRDPSGSRLGGTRLAVDLASTRGRMGRFVVPATSGTVAARSLLAYNRLRPRTVRAARALMASALRVGGTGWLTTPAPITASPDAECLVDALADLLDEPALVIAGTDHGGSGFRTPVLQLFTPAGRPRGYAKLGWDPVTAAMIDTEATALQRAETAGWSTLSVPKLAWHGIWHDLTVLVTEPMPANVRRLRRSELPPIEPLHEIGAMWGPVHRLALTDTVYWAQTRHVASTASDAGQTDLQVAVDAFERDFAGVELRVGAWHGDWVEWNLGRAGDRMLAWDWAYSAPAVPFGFDLLQFFHLRHRNLRGAKPEVALARAAVDAAPGLRALGIDATEQDAVTRLHRIEVAARDARARNARAQRIIPVAESGA